MSTFIKRGITLICSTDKFSGESFAYQNLPRGFGNRFSHCQQYPPHGINRLKPSSSWGCLCPSLTNNRAKDLENFDDMHCPIIAALPALASACHRKKVGQKYRLSDKSLNYCENFLSMMFAQDGDAPINPSLSKALDLDFFFYTQIMSKTAQPQHAE